MASWDEPRPKLPKRRPRQDQNDSISYSIRLYPVEVELIEARAEKLGLDRLELLVAELRSLVG